ncbi:MAG: FAD-dependent oxidoreductase [Candidatus Lokiarchaeota archaeon]|nr:FAD-dependent oxidoreductase [Candidatus Lokiarchaeota archaeon]
MHLKTRGIEILTELRIGVFVCNCGSNIGSIINCSELADYAKNLPNVVFAEDNLYTCSETGLTKIKNGIKEHNLNRVVVAACTPRTHEPLFRGICNEMGLNPYYFEFVNIREQCSWVHQKEIHKANLKARDLVKMGVARSARLEALEKYQVEVTSSSLVIGGGISGITAALSLAEQGFEVYLVEKKRKLGGMLNDLYRISPNYEDPSEYLQLVKKVEQQPKIILHTNSEIISIEGYIGNFYVTIKGQNKVESVEVGTIIVAVGAQVLKPVDYYNYNGKDIITHQELEKLLKENKINQKNIVMIQCVGSRIEERHYCSNICCMNALKNAIIIKERAPDTNITILYRDINTPGTKNELYYRDVRKNEVIFLRYNVNKPPVIEDGKIRVYNNSLKDDIELDYDLVVLSTPLIPNEDNKALSQMLKVPLEENGFFLEAHVKLRPVDFATDGLFVCGSAKWPVSISEAIAQAKATAAKAAIILCKPRFEVEGSTARVDTEKCVGCEVCIKICPYGAITKDDNDQVLVRNVLCKGCGLCGATCPHQAISINHFTNPQILSQINALVERE